MRDYLSKGETEMFTNSKRETWNAGAGNMSLSDFMIREDEIAEHAARERETRERIRNAQAREIRRMARTNVTAN